MMLRIRLVPVMELANPSNRDARKALDRKVTCWAIAATAGLFALVSFAVWVWFKPAHSNVTLAVLLTAVTLFVGTLAAYWKAHAGTSYYKRAREIIEIHNDTREEFHAFAQEAGISTLSPDYNEQLFFLQRSKNNPAALVSKAFGRSLVEEYGRRNRLAELRHMQEEQLRRS
jgi:hypothetical protein